MSPCQQPTSILTKVSCTPGAVICRKHHKEAVASFQHAVVAAPEDARPLFRLGNALFAIQQFHDSQEAFSRALSFASLPEDAALLPKIHVNLGISLEAEGQLELACQHYRCYLCATIKFLVHCITAAASVNVMIRSHLRLS